MSKRSRRSTKQRANLQQRAADAAEQLRRRGISTPSPAPTPKAKPKPSRDGGGRFTGGGQ